MKKGDKPGRVRSWQMDSSPVHKKEEESEESDSEEEAKAQQRHKPKPPPPRTQGKKAVESKKTDDYDHDRKRHHVYGKKKEDIVNPTKKNNYLGRRMSEVLRGEDPELPDLRHIFYDDNHSELEKEKNQASSWFEKLELIYKTKMAEKRAVPRLLLCGMAVSFLWASSVATCKAVVNQFIPSPSYQQVETDVVDLRGFVEDARDSYEACVLKETRDCREVYISARDAEQARVLGVQNSNDAILTSMDANRTRCAGNYKIMLNKLIEYANANSNLVPSKFAPDSNNVPAICNDVDALPAAQLAAIAASEASALAAANASEALDAHQSMLDERIQYDTDYLDLFNTTYTQRMAELQALMYNASSYQKDMQASLNIIKACINQSFVDEDGQKVECDQTNLDTLLDGYIGVYSDSLTTANNSLASYAQSFQSTLKDAQRLMKGVNAASSVVNSAGFDINAPPFNLLDDVPDINDLYNFIDDYGDDVLYSAGIDPDEFDQIIQQSVDNVNAQIALAQEQLANLTAEVNARQQAFAEQMGANFTPPAENATLAQNADQARQNAATLQASIEEDLGGISLNADDIPTVSNVSSFANQTAVELIDGLKDRTLDFFAYDDDIFRKISANFELALNMGLAFDTVWRVLQSLMLVKKYWSVSAIATPPADVRSDKGALFKEKKNPLQQLAGVLSNPGIEMVFVILAILILSLLFYVAYLPIFNEYVEGCIDNDETDIRNGKADGTMLYRNVLSLTTAFALSAGDTAISTGIDQLNLERQLSCRDFFDASVQTRNDQNDTFVDIQAGMNNVNDQYNLFVTCVDWARFDTAALQQTNVDPVSTVNNSAVPSFFAGFNDETCVEVYLPSFLTFDDTALHHCAAIPECVPNCEGVDQISFERENHDTSCTTEFAFHAYFLITLFATTMYVCLNIARFYLLRGIIELFWPHLCLDLHTYLMSCTERGKILPPERVEKGDLFSDVIHDALNKSLRSFTMRGVFDVCYAIFINFPWIIFMAIISKDIHYRSVSEES